MGRISALAQCALDFLVDERCHACGLRLNAVAATPAPHALAAPIDILSLPGLRLQTRVLCALCAERVVRWREPVLLTPRAPQWQEPLSIFPAYVTDERVLTLIHLLKFGGRERLAPWLAAAMTTGLPGRAHDFHGTPPLVIPVPMDRAARERRGFNQAESIARALAATWQLSLCARALIKVRRTRPQSALGREERLYNLDRAFEAEAARVCGRAAILVDDLVTTGATVFACAEALRAAGAAGVRIVCAGYRDDNRAEALSSILTMTSGTL